MRRPKSRSSGVGDDDVQDEDLLDLVLRRCPGPALSSSASTIVFSTQQQHVGVPGRRFPQLLLLDGLNHRGRGGGFQPEQAELWGSWRRDGPGQDFWGSELSKR